ncbi:MAG: endonuclease domain-containing protein [Burkholderiales bacterium]
MRLSLSEAKRLGLKIAAMTPGGALQPARCRAKRLPDDVLWAEIGQRYPEAVRELQGAVPGRRYRIDIALPSIRVALEVDGWQFHGQHRKAHQSDRERQNLLVVNGWLVLRFTTGQIFKDMPSVLDTIHAACRLRAAANTPTASPD